MPLYLDRHDSLGNVTKEDILEGHKRDIAVGEKYGVYFVTYWCDLETGLAFCHIDAPSKELALAVHREAHGDGMVADEIIEVEPDQVRQFLGRVLSPDGYWDNALRTILVTDMEGSTALVQRLGDKKANEIFHHHDRIIGEALSLMEGRKIKHTGDGVLAAFDSVARALQCATAIQHKIADYNDSLGAVPIRVRIGLTAGEPVTEHADLFGAAVHQATRICSFCDPGRIVASRVVRDLSIGKGFVWNDLGQIPLRGFDESVQLYELRWAPEVEEQVGSAKQQFDRPGADERSGAPRGNIFLREGEYWTIVYEGEAFRLKDTKGLRYLSELLRNPGREFHALDLVGIAQERDQDSASRSMKSSERSLPSELDLGDAGALLDPRAKTEYRRRLEALREQLEEANRFNDEERVTRLRQEIDFLASELSSAVGLGGRDRKAASAAERARVNVSRTIADAVKRISDHSRSLGCHLDSTIRTGTFCCYTPDPRAPVAW
jgi:class 3 adenylate cyclase